MKTFYILAAAVLCLPLANASTLQQLTLADLSVKSSVVIRGTVQGQSAVLQHGGVVYTHYRVTVTELWKGSLGSQVDVAVPGGMLNGARETYGGTPELAVGGDYVLFLWTSRTGLTQVIGLSQGLFSVVANAASGLAVSRAAASERMVDATGKPTSDSSFQMSLNDFRSQVQTIIRGGR